MHEILYYTFNGCEVILKNKAPMLNFDFIDITIQKKSNFPIFRIKLK